jgi:hypothetical protein
MPSSDDRLESFGIYQLACQLFDDFRAASEILGKNGRHISKSRAAKHGRAEGVIVGPGICFRLR